MSKRDDLLRAMKEVDAEKSGSVLKGKSTSSKSKPSTSSINEAVGITNERMHEIMDLLTDYHNRDEVDTWNKEIEWVISNADLSTPEKVALGLIIGRKIQEQMHEHHAKEGIKKALKELLSDE